MGSRPSVGRFAGVDALRGRAGLVAVLTDVLAASFVFGAAFPGAALFLTATFLTATFLLAATFDLLGAAFDLPPVARPTGFDGRLGVLAADGRDATAVVFLTVPAPFFGAVARTALADFAGLAGERRAVAFFAAGTARTAAFAVRLVAGLDDAAVRVDAGRAAADFFRVAATFCGRRTPRLAMWRPRVKP
jgi:hypothetical protein